jgi:short-subunit dehydrogenase
MQTTKRIVIVGATSLIAEHCARIWASAQPVDLLLVGRDAARLERVAQDLRVRAAGGAVNTRTSGFADDIDATVAAACADGLPDIVLIAHGMLPDQAACQADLPALREALEVNAVSPVLFAEAFAQRMAQHPGGTLALIGSVAGDRGRKSNYAYGAAKGLVERYVQGLQHRFGAGPLTVVLIKPGPTATPMTAHLQDKAARLAPVEQVAQEIVAGIARGQAVIYTPKKWRLIMLVIRNLPAFVFNKMDI